MGKNGLATAAPTALASLAHAAVAGHPAYAAELVPALSWTGCYAGAGVGGVWGSSEKWIVRTPGGAELSSASRSADTM